MANGNESTRGSRGLFKKRGNITLADKSNLTPLSESLYNNYGVKLDVDSLIGTDLNAVESATEGIKRVLDEFPGIAAEIKVVKGEVLEKKKTYAKAGFNGDIILNRDQYDSNKVLSGKYAKDVKGKYHPKGSDSSYIGTHEAAHMIERALINKYVGDNDPIIDKALKHKAWETHFISSGVINQAVRNIQATKKGKNKTSDKFIAQVSGYSKKNRSETFAECVVDYMANGKKAKPLSKEVWAILKKEFE